MERPELELEARRSDWVTTSLGNQDLWTLSLSLSC
jgi:hypothetical protein